MDFKNSPYSKELSNDSFITRRSFIDDYLIYNRDCQN